MKKYAKLTSVRNYTNCVNKMQEDDLSQTNGGIYNLVPIKRLIIVYPCYGIPDIPEIGNSIVRA
jgi:hypothetical protein